ncbi:MAG: hypothetical protein SOW59_08080 [Corynebacterium sp.]|nr:hypothetical protein [Corynebacterium sp.]
MADEKQLTVAELLARNAKERAGGADNTDGTPRRRRRRSLEEGGISVAELTGSLPKVTEAPPQSRHSNVDINETAPVIPAPKTDPVEQASPAVQQEASTEPTAKPEMKAQAVKPADDETTIIKKVEVPEEVPADTKSAATAEVPETRGEYSLEDSSAEDDDVAYSAEEEKLSAFSVVFLALAGIVLGAVVFKGFEILWGRFDRMVVTLLAAMTTIAIVGLVHALRTNRDVLSMILGAIVGLVLTFGPLLIILL